MTDKHVNVARAKPPAKIHLLLSHRESEDIAFDPPRLGEEKPDFASLHELIRSFDAVRMWTPTKTEQGKKK